MTKQITLALAALGLSATALAGHPANAMMPLPVSNDINLTAPYQEGMWSFGVEALYWEAANNDLNYAIATVGTGTANVTTRVRSVEPKYDFGWRADVSYHFPGNGRDVNLSYTHFHSDESSNTRRDGTTTVLGSVNSSILPTPTNFETARGVSDDDYDAVDLTFGQKIDVGQRVRLHPFAGIRYADIDSSDKTRYTGTSTTTSSVLNDRSFGRVRSEFQGLGPRFGSDAQVNLGSGFMFTGRMGVSLLVGDRDSKASNLQQSLDTTTSAVTTQVDNAYRISSHTRVVPEADARIGIAYAHNWNGGTGMGIELGYEVTNYFDAVDNSLLSYADTSGHDTDFAMHGPYLRLQLDIA